MITKKDSLGVVAGVIALDQFTKYLVMKKIVFSVLAIRNSGLAFGLTLPGFFNFLVVAGVLILFMIIYTRDFASERTRLGFVLVLGGALSNILDRVVRGAVLDFINLGISTINVADVAIFLGLTYLLFTV